MAKKRIIILGAGLSGLSVAWHLQQGGAECLLFEKDRQAGGLCRSKKVNGFIFDYDGHLLHCKEEYTLRLATDLLGGNLASHCKSSWIFSHGRYTRYPFQANLYGLPSAVVKECLMGFIEISRNGHNAPADNFLDWINNKFGKGIARHFMVPYNTKFWTIPPQEMGCSWLDGFVPTPSLKQVIDGTIRENKKPLGYNAHFWYPKKGGINQLPEAFAAGLKNLRTGQEVTFVDLGKKQIRISSGEKEPYDILVSTIPLPELAHIASGLPQETAPLFRKLRWNSVFNLNLGVSQKDYLGRHWVYFPGEELSFFRVGFFNNFSATLAPEGASSLYAEVSYSKHKPLDKTKVVARITDDLKKAGILAQGAAVVAEDVNDIQYGYPIYDRQYHQVRDALVASLARFDVIPAGRYGSWRYMSMEDCILDGKAVAERLLR